MATIPIWTPVLSVYYLPPELKEKLANIPPREDEKQSGYFGTYYPDIVPSIMPFIPYRVEGAHCRAEPSYFYLAIHAIVNALTRYPFYMLGSSDVMENFGKAFPEGKIEGKHGPEYAYLVLDNKYMYIFVLSPNNKAEPVRVHGYRKTLLWDYIEKYAGKDYWEEITVINQYHPSYM